MTRIPKYVIIPIFLLLFPINILRAQVDTSYVVKFKRELALQAYLSKKYTSLSYQFPSEYNEHEYMPNSRTRLGVGVMWKAFALYLGYGFKFLNDADKGNTKSLDLQLHYYGRRFLIDFFGQNYQGFYMEYPEKSGNYVLRPDLKIFQYGVVGQYVFNGNKFSYTAAFNQDEWQKRSAGSFHLGLGLYYSLMMADSSYLLGGTIVNHQELRSVLVGPNLGYAYTFVIGRRFFITPSLTVGLHVGFTSVDKWQNKDVDAYPAVFPRIALGYNAERWALCLSYTNNKVSTAKSEDATLKLNTGSLLLIFSRRFSFHPKIPDFLKPIL